MADEPVADRYTVTLSPESTPADVEAANARANERDPRGAEPVADASTATAPAADAALDEGAEEDEQGEGTGEDVERPRMPRRVKQALDQRDQARNEARAEREARIRLEERLALAVGAEETQAPKPQVTTPARPDINDFDSDEEYMDALVDWRTEQRLQAFRDEQAQHQADQAAKDAAKPAVERHTDAINRARSAHADFDRQVQSIPAVSPLLNAGFQHLENSGDVLYHLATNPDVLTSLNGETNPLVLGAELRALDQRFTPAGNTSADAEDEPTEPKTPPARGLTPIDAAPDADASAYNPYEDIGDYEKFLAWRNKQKS